MGRVNGTALKRADEESLQFQHFIGGQGWN